MLVWTDLETTGLDPGTCEVLEVAAIVTTDQLIEVARFQRVVFNPQAWMVLGADRCGRPDGQHITGSSLDPFVIDMHLKNGLWKDCTTGFALETVDHEFVNFIAAHAVKEFTYVDEKDGQTKTGINKPQLAGSTISFDRGFIAQHLPLALGMLHYRNIDVSSFNETGRRFWPDVYATRPKSQDKAHRGMADIEESIAQYKHYLLNVGSKPGATAFFNSDGSVAATWMP